MKTNKRMLGAKYPASVAYQAPLKLVVTFVSGEVGVLDLGMLAVNAPKTDWTKPLSDADLAKTAYVTDNGDIAFSNRFDIWGGEVKKLIEAQRGQHGKD